MVNESDDKMEGQDEGEYHFSDDQINYEMETELPKAAAPVAPKANILTKLTPYRRMIIGMNRL